MPRLFRPLKPLLAALMLVSSAASAERLIVRGYSVIDGLGGDLVHCLVTDREGFFWICTDGGLSRFDVSAPRSPQSLCWKAAFSKR
jgi:ligand-binding sensor domain-containing protein